MFKTTIGLFSLLSFLLIVTLFMCLMFGGSRIPVNQVIYAITHPQSREMSHVIVWQIRLPRIVLGLLVGAGLSCCGCVFQGMLRNPLAESYTLGVSGGAALGATFGIVFGVYASLGSLWLPAFAFLGAIFCISLVYFVGARHRFSNPTLILGGVMLNFLCSSGVLLVFAISKTQDILSTVRWLMGDLSFAEPDLIKIVGPLILVGAGILLMFGRDLDLLSLGEEKASYLGLDPEWAKKILFTIASLITGACVAAAGIIGFVGLMIPHVMRKISGPNHQTLIPASAIGGAIFLALSDTLARSVMSPMELPVGVVTGILGGFFFLIYLFRSKGWEVF